MFVVSAMIPKVNLKFFLKKTLSFSGDHLVSGDTVGLTNDTVGSAI